ncbi:hypothetical protein [uncultured Tateyamaria sp.]|uniref:hypothetical protein n=1 Tax=uncultured Tateyamaria sp. TaxID=455651 RepID=UPI0026148DED|nr:hypothetical protein [uncultured Tateyamaria sp.]
MRRFFILAGLAPLAMAAFHGSAIAQQSAPCSPAEVLKDRLTSTYQEHPIWRGMASETQMVTVFAHRDGGSFSIVVTHANGLACLVSAGTGWEAFTLPEEGEVH